MNFDLSLTGFSADELQALLAPDPSGGLTDPDEVPEPPAKPSQRTSRAPEGMRASAPARAAKFPSSRAGYATLCDPGHSIVDLRHLHPALFSASDWYASKHFARAREQWASRQIRISAIEPGKPFEEQSHELIARNRSAECVYLIETARSRSIVEDSIR